MMLWFGMLLLSVSAAPAQERMLRGARVIRVLAEKGEKIQAGPLTLFIDPQTGRLCKEVTADPGSDQLIAAIHLPAGKGAEVRLFLIQPVSARERRAMAVGTGRDLFLVVPDDLGKRDIRARTLWLKGRKDGRRYTRQVGYYEVLGYTSKDVFLALESVGRMDRFFWSDGGGKTEERPIAGYGILSFRAERKTVRIGERYRVWLSLWSNLPVDLLVYLRSDGAPDAQARRIRISGDRVVEFEVQSRRRGIENNSVALFRIRDATRVRDEIGFVTPEAIQSPQSPHGLPPEWRVLDGLLIQEQPRLIDGRTRMGTAAFGADEVLLNRRDWGQAEKVRKAILERRIRFERFGAEVRNPPVLTPEMVR